MKVLIISWSMVNNALSFPMLLTVLGAALSSNNNLVCGLASSSVVVEFQMMDRRDWNKSRLNKIRMKHQSIMGYRLSDGHTLRTDYGQTTSEVWKIFLGGGGAGGTVFHTTYDVFLLKISNRKSCSKFKPMVN